ncbi:MAG: hypothetical protein ACOC42_01695 [Halobacteriota archaeon]
MAESTARHVFVGMLKEEWRLHSRLFGGARFAAFPLVVFTLVAGAVGLLTVTGVILETSYFGLHVLVLVFGLHTGSIGFIGRDAVRNLLGEMTLLVFSARTLPISRHRLVGVFIVKDLLYYAALFITPIAAGVAPTLLVLEAVGIPTVAVTVAHLWLTLLAMFALGIVSTLALLGLAGRGISRLVIVLAVLLAVGGAWLAALDPWRFTGYGFFVAPGLETALLPLATIGLVATVGLVTFRVESHRPQRRVDARFRRWNRHLDDPVATKSLLDVHRSSGGFAKVLFSAAILFAVTAVLVGFAGQVTGVRPGVAVAYGTILGLTGFTSFNWLTQVDDVDGYLVHPLDVADVFRAKWRAFVVLGPVVAVAFYLVGVAWQGADLASGLVGGFLAVAVTAYVFGVTSFLAGLSPNEFLFDSGLFAVFGLAMAVPLVPLLVVAFAFEPLSWSVVVSLAIAAVILVVVGLTLYHAAIDRWTARLVG